MTEEYTFPFASETPYHQEKVKFPPFAHVTMMLEYFFPQDGQSAQDITSNVVECPGYLLFYPFESIVLNPDLVYAVKMLCIKPNLTKAEAKRANQLMEMFKTNQFVVDENWWVLGK